jgi:hypothetical protein
MAGSTYFLKGNAFTKEPYTPRKDIQNYPGHAELEKHGKKYKWHALHWANDGAAIGWYSRERRHLIVAVRGTKMSSLNNIVTDLRYFKKKHAALGGTRVHSGFEESARFLFRELREAELLPPSKDKDQWRVTLTGHSLGGAVATVLGMYLHIAGFPVSEIVTFGQPMLTNWKGAHEWNSLIPLVRIVNDNDPVAVLPPTLPLPLNLRGGRFWHFGDQIRITEKGLLKPRGFKETLTSPHNSFWREVAHRHIKLGDHNASPGDFDPQAILKQDALGPSADSYKGGYFEELLFALYRLEHPHDPAVDRIHPRTNRNLEWVRFKQRKIHDTYSKILNQEKLVDCSLPLEASLKNLKDLNDNATPVQ